MSGKPATSGGMLARVRRGLAPLVVLSVLGLIGWWGHHTHWDFSHALGSGEHGERESEPKPPAPPPAVGSNAPLSISGELPKIEFSSSEAAYNCGIETEVVTERTLNDHLVASAEVGFDKSHHAELAVRVTGTVFHVERGLGAAVKKGDLLMVIDSADVGDAKLDLLQACVIHRLKTQRRDRLKELQNAIAGKELIEAEADYQLATSERFNALQRLVNMGLSLTLAEIDSLSEEALEEKLHYLGLPADSRLQTGSYNLFPVIAPFDGTIIRCEAVRGEAVGPLAPLYVLTDMRKMWMHLNVRQDDAAKIHLGAPIEFESPMDGRILKGSINWIGSEIDPRTRMIQARAEVENPLVEESGSAESRRVLLAGTYGSAKIILHRQTALAAPNSSMHWVWEIGREVIFVATDNGRKFEPLVVTKGIVRDGYVQIQGGLKPGTKVVTDGSRILAAELSEHLQKRIGDNAEAIRAFEHSHDLHGEGTPPQGN